MNGSTGNYEVLRATEEWQRTGAYSVRIQGMNRQYHISLREEFDEHDGEASKYIVVLDDGYPIATCRFYETSKSQVMVGRVVVLPEYRGMEVGRLVVNEAEKWIRELGYQEILIDSRISIVPFYEKLGYTVIGTESEMNSVFECIRMQKRIESQAPLF